jgi:aminomuconate-semialdehyde/2-hydroxymuconate-6-semialdehyde dehydrogenase
MACGNTVVVKPSEATPSTATLLGEVMNKVGVPPGVYNVVNGFGVNSAGSFLTAHQGVNGITFTGETKTGTAIMKAGCRRHSPGVPRTGWQKRRGGVCRLRLRERRQPP